MIFIFIFVCTVSSALLHLYLTRETPHTRERVVEVFLLFFLCGQWGFGAILTSVPHIVTPDTIAKAISAYERTLVCDDTAYACATWATSSTSTT